MTGIHPENGAIRGTVPFARPHVQGEFRERDRHAPVNIEAEQGVIGSALLDNTTIGPMRSWVGPDDFFRDAHAILFRALADVYDARSSVDAVLLADELNHRDQLAAIGGEDYLAEVLQSVPHAANAVHYAQIVRQKALARRVLDAASLTLDDVYSNTYTAEQLLSLARTRINLIESTSLSVQEEPDLDRIPRAAPFPVDVLPEALAQFVDAAAGSVPCPVDYVALPCLAIAGGVIGRSIAVRLKDSWKEMANLWAVVVGGPGSAKSPAIEFAQRPLWRIANQLAGEYEVEKAMAVETKRLKAAAAKTCGAPPGPDDPPPVYRRINAIDATPESLPPVMAENPRGLVFVHDELSGLINGMNQYRAKGGNEQQFYLKLWNRAAIMVDRKSNENRVPIIVREPFVTITGAMTPDMLDTMPTNEGGRRRNDGFMDRFLFAYPEKIRRRWVNSSPSPEIEADWSDAIFRLWSLPLLPDDHSRAGRPYWLDLKPEARERYAAWYDERCVETEEPDFPSDLEGPWSKSFAYCGRLAIVLHMLDWAFDPTSPELPPPIGTNAIERAIRLMEYFDVHYRRVMAHIQGGDGGTPESRDGLDLIEWAKGRGRPRFTTKEAKDNFRRRFAERPEALAAALAWLESRRAVQKLPAAPRPGGGRRPPETYEIHPSLLKSAREMRDRGQGATQ